MTGGSPVTYPLKDNPQFIDLLIHCCLLNTQTHIMPEIIYVNPGRKLRSEIEAGSLDQMLRAEVGVARGQHPPDS